MVKRKIFILAGILLLLVIVYVLVQRENRSVDYLYNNRTGITYKDASKSVKRIDFNNSNVKAFFAETIINPYTIRFFGHLQNKFIKADTKEEHMELVNNYLATLFSPDEADRLTAFYGKYITYEQKLTERFKSIDRPSDLNGAIEILKKVKEYREDYFGKNTATLLFGPEIKMTEYGMRMKAVLKNENLYGEEKLRHLSKLKEDMWGEEGSEIKDFDTPSERYNAMVEIYKRDLNEMSHEERTAKINEMRKKYFSSTVVENYNKYYEKMKSDLERGKQ